MKYLPNCKEVFMPKKENNKKKNMEEAKTNRTDSFYTNLNYFIRNSSFFSPLGKCRSFINQKEKVLQEEGNMKSYEKTYLGKPQETSWKLLRIQSGGQFHKKLS